MTPANRFSVSGDSRIVTPDAPGLATLVALLRRGASIHARQATRQPISAGAEPKQCLLCETSGSTGGAKVIRRDPASWIASFEVNRQLFGLTTKDSYATLGSLGHSLSLYAAIEALHLGADIAAFAGQRPMAQMRALEQAGSTVIYATPTQLRLLRDAARRQGAVLPKARLILCGGGLLEPALQADLPGFFPNAAIHAFYGASETSFITIADADTPPGSVGRAYPGVTLRIDAAGEIWVRSPYLFSGYAAGGPGDTRRDGDDLSVGEMGHLDAGGYLTLRGRKSRMVTVADINVFPEEIEQALSALPGVTHCVALPLADPQRGHRIACVIEGPGAVAREAEFRRHCRKALGAASVPHAFVVLERMPLLPAGKPDLQALQRMLEETQ